MSFCYEQVLQNEAHSLTSARGPDAKTGSTFGRGRPLAQDQSGGNLI
jgi:hypothetical protein